MHIARKHLPSPLTAEGSGGGGTRASSPHPNLPPPGGKGCVPPPVSPLTGEGLGGGEGSVFSPILTFPRRGGKGYLPLSVSHLGGECVKSKMERVTRR
jgi:hypothetical protein